MAINQEILSLNNLKNYTGPTAEPASTTTPKPSTTTPAAPTTITTAQTQPAPAFNLTQPKPATQMAGLGGAIEVQTDAFTESLKASQAAAQTKKDSSLSAYLEALATTPGKTQLTDEAYRKTVDPLEQELNEINSQIREEQHSLRRRLEALDKNPQGLFGGALEAEKQRITNESIAKQADLAVIQMARQGRYDSAKAIADRAVAAKLEQQQNYIEALRVNYEDNKSLFTTAEQRAFETMLADRNRALDMEAYKEKARFDAIISANSTGGSGGVNDQLYSGLSTPTATAVRGKVTKFSSEPVVQNFATIQEGFNFVSSLSNTTTNPADDQALIYALAKTLDPGSVVREGEYNTAQKYAQSWISAYGKSVEHALAGTGFLSEDARKNIKKVIESRYKSSRDSYDNLYTNYTKSIDALTGRADGAAFLTDYAAPAPAAPVVSEDEAIFDSVIETQGNQGLVPQLWRWLTS